MDFFSKTYAFVKKQSAQWHAFNKTEKQYLNSPAGTVKSCGRGVAHWALASLLAIYGAVSLLYEGRTTEIPGRDIILTSCYIMAGCMLVHLVLDYGFKRLSKKRFLGYVLGAATGAAILIWNMPDILHFSIKSVLQYIAYLSTPYFLCEIIAYILGPMTAEWN